jgi:hypothetical protein
MVCVFHRIESIPDELSTTLGICKMFEIIIEDEADGLGCHDVMTEFESYPVELVVDLSEFLMGFFFVLVSQRYRIHMRQLSGPCSHRCRSLFR